MIKPDCSQMRFDPTCSQTMLSKYPELKGIVVGEDYNISAQHNASEVDALLRYVILCYDPSSPIYLNEPDLIYRQKQSADIAGIKKNEEYRNLVWSMSLDGFDGLLVSYLQRFVKNKEWAAIVAFEANYWESIRLLTKAIKIDSDLKDKEILDALQKKSLIKNELESDRDKIELWQQKFAGKDPNIMRVIKKRAKADNLHERYN